MTYLVQIVGTAKINNFTLNVMYAPTAFNSQSGRVALLLRK